MASTSNSRAGKDDSTLSISNVPLMNRRAVLLICGIGRQQRVHLGSVFVHVAALPFGAIAPELDARRDHTAVKVDVFRRDLKGLQAPAGPRQQVVLQQV